MGAEAELLGEVRGGFVLSLVLALFDVLNLDVIDGSRCIVADYLLETFDFRWVRFEKARRRA